MEDNDRAILLKDARESAARQPRVDIMDVLEKHRGERHIVVLHDYPDPDAISSAFAHELLSAEFDIEVDVVYAGQISHNQNVALVKLLGLELMRFEASLNLKQYVGAVFVDNQGTAADEVTRALQQAGVPTLMVIDHHELQERLQPEFSDIRRVGATATIYTEYLERGLVEMQKSRREHVVLATALTHGIMTDTENLVRGSEADFHAAAFLSRFREADLLRHIMSQARSKQTMDVIRRALGNRTLVESYSIAGIGYLRIEDRDAIPQAADFLLTEENVHTAIVYGLVMGDSREEMLIGSLRTSKITLNPDDFLKDVFGKDAQGHYFGGGKESAGAFEVPVGFLSDVQAPEMRDLKWQVYDNQVKQKLFGKIGVGQQAGE